MIKFIALTKSGCDKIKLRERVIILTRLKENVKICSVLFLLCKTNEVKNTGKLNGTCPRC